MSLVFRLMLWTSAILLFSITNVFSYIFENSNEQIDNDIKYGLTRNIKSVALLKNIIEGMDKNLARGVYKRGCNFNLPGFECDNAKMIHSGADSAWWRRGMTPGKKRSGCINADGSACDAAQIVVEMNNRKPWMNGPGRRK